MESTMIVQIMAPIRYEGFDMSVTHNVIDRVGCATSKPFFVVVKYSADVNDVIVRFHGHLRGVGVVAKGKIEGAVKQGFAMVRSYCNVPK